MAINLARTAASQKLNKIAEKSIEEVNSKVVKDIPLDLIDPHPDNLKIYSMEGIDSLMVSIEKNGFIGAIDVYSKPDGRYLIYSGHRRYAAMKALGRTTIPCLVYKLEDTYTINRKLIEANINTRILSPLEKAKQLAYFEKNLLDSGFTGSINKEMEETFGISFSTITRLKSITKLIDEIQAWASSPKFPYGAFADASTLPKKSQYRLYELIRDELERFPDAELTSNLVVQMLAQVKREIEKEALKKELQKAVPEPEPVYEEEPVAEIDTSNDEIIYIDDDTESEEVDPDDDMPAMMTSKKIDIPGHIQSTPYGDAAESRQDDRMDAEQDLLHFINGMESILIKDNISLSSSGKDIATSRLKNIIKKIESM